MEKSIIVSNVSKKHKLYTATSEKLKDIFFKKSYGEDFYALKNVNFHAYKGEVVGFVGVNGAGKSTLSNIIAGILPESSGKVIVNGTVSLIAISSGLKGNLTGRENIELKCLMLGYSKEEILKLEPEIIDFAELGKFIDQPVKSYSSGMKSRLGFAISVTIDPDIIIIDEALSVGDKAFGEKSFQKMMEFKKKGKTIVFVSHSIPQMKKFADKILWLEYGRVKAYGLKADILPKYESFIKEYKNMSKLEKEDYRKKSITSALLS
ncbi:MULTISPECIES: teichoic acids export ABC transporter ATP-binding subunit TagH [Virgibacillus]|uniref:Teichoic acids export ATP-binding protein TagH n=1 Tax=Virgibacillus dokdonensis TaxID=302167 RepID=A0A2K9J1T4_9BACI|nr:MULTISPECIES: teichoic acids export ABC transporter ATP-binding subunit TagH [Virgibacillus]AUJ23971.1 Teichoic acids export ATP-binding protein TagH [Virgibacillus dokdonensis]NWO14452.1 teichoic acids export ABC transporter ATP-binding subunit TagH [Virgibacillus sp.]